MKTADLSDAHAEVQIAQPIFNSYGANAVFSGKIYTVKCFEDNTFIRKSLETKVDNGVLVVDAGGSQRCAMLGDILAQMGVDNGWVGGIFNGLIRDSADINQMPFGVKALGTIPIRSVKEGLGKTEVAVNFAGVTFTPGHYVYADHDGVIVSAKPLSLPE